METITLELPVEALRPATFCLPIIIKKKAVNSYDSTEYWCITADTEGWFNQTQVIIWPNTAGIYQSHLTKDDLTKIMTKANHPTDGMELCSRDEFFEALEKAMQHYENIIVTIKNI